VKGLKTGLLVASLALGFEPAHFRHHEFRLPETLYLWGVNLRDWKYEHNHDQGIDGPDQPD
jgi:hypothetical protein